MVLGRNDKRKRKEGDLVDLMDPLSESPKRTKVHAQRKFAQGAATVFSPAPTLVKEKEKTSKPAMITELITHKRPNTEDFLTFLCFRGTSILPPSLNFFNMDSKKEKSETKTLPAPKLSSKPSSSSSGSTTIVSKPESSSNSQSKSSTKTSSPIKKKVTTAVQKNLTKFKTATSTIQALKKKYQEQRLAKQRIKNKFKASCVMRTRSSTERVLLKSGSKLAPRKFVSRNETKRHGLRSSGFPEKIKKPNIAQTKGKPIPSKPKKRLIAKEQTSESSESETESSDDETPRSKITPQIKRPIGKVMQKKVCTRSKSEMRRITRSQRDRAPSSQGLSRRPSRKTKEAAAVYMEILGRKLVSPDLENEDNISVDSFPELPNARRTAQAESEIRAKSKQGSKQKEVKEKDSKSENTSNATKNKTKVEKPILKSKRTLRVRRYCELDSEDESEASVEPDKTRTVTRRSVTKLDKPAVRSLRSSLRNQPSKPEVKETTVAAKEKIVKRVKPPQKREESEESEEEMLGNLLDKMKKKKEENSEVKKPEIKKLEPKKLETKKSEMKKPETKKSDNKKPETTKLEVKKSDVKKSEIKKSEIIKPEIKKSEINKSEIKKSETNKSEIKKSEVNKAEIKKLDVNKSEIKKLEIKKLEIKKLEIKKIESNEEPSIVEPKIETPAPIVLPENVTPSQVSDDEESFRGFTKKAISKVLNSCNSHVNANLLASEEAYGKLDVLKTQEKPQVENSTSRDAKRLTLEKVVEQPITVAPAFTIVNPVQEPATISIPEIESPSLDDAIKLETKCNHVAESSAINLIDMQLTGIHGRKARVNMSTEQIEKWLNESSMARAKQRNKPETEASPNFSFEAPEKMKDSTHLSIPTRIQHLVRPVNVTIPKVIEKANARERMGLQSRSATNFIAGMRIPLAKPLNIPTIPNRNKINADIKEIIKGRVTKPSKETSTGEESDTVSKSDQNSVDGSPDKKSTPEKKAIFQQRKTFLPKVKERKTTTPSANAFSPENESSVYAFESDTEVPINTPFRRKLKELQQKIDTPSEPDNSRTDNEESSKFSDIAMSSENEGKNSSSKGFSSVDNSSNKFPMPKSFGNLSNVQVLPLGKMPTEWGGVNCSASIAVQVNFNEQSQERQQEQLSQVQESEDSLGQQKCTEISTQTENTNDHEDDNDGGHVFYIPLQTVTRNGPNLGQGQQFIQGVAVKLGTEGPTGPNQRVLLRAQLVTKPPIAVARCPPVGTVQPTTRTPPSSSSSTSILDHPYAVPDNPVASTSAITAPAPVATPANTDFQAPLQQPSKSGSTNQNARQSSSTGPGNAPDKAAKSPKATRERKASLDSTKTGKRASAKSKLKMSEILSPSNTTAFPGSANTNAEARLVEAPTFHPTEKDFQDPLEYIDKIRPIAEKFGICRVVPPANFKPECKVSDDMRFTAYNQYVHRMLHRWGPNVKEMMAIKKYLATQSITLTHPPWIGGMEVDLPHLYQTVQSLGGLKEVIEKKKWQKVADGMKIPKSAQDRVTKLDDIYCKYLLPYDTLSPEERGKLFDDVEEKWKKRETKTLQRLDAQMNDNDDEEDDDSSDEIEECIVKGRNMPLNAFYRIARNTQRMWFGENQRSGSEAEGASASEVETAFWKHVAERKRHVCVHAASIDSSGRGFGFSVAKNSPFARHPWNLKVLTNNAGSVLRALGPLMGVTVPTLHVGMLFSACCWYRDPHGLPWIEYLHTGAKKIWYGIPDEHNNNFREALSKMVPRYCKKKTIWLPSDTAMVPPETLVNNEVPLCKTVQEPGQFIIVFPKAFTSSICTGYVVSESVYFAQPAWLENAEQVFKDLQDSCEPSIFSFERLLFSIINDSRSHIDVLKQIMPAMLKIRERELEFRKQLEFVGLTNKEKLPLPDTGKGKKGKKVKEEDSDFECETCRANLFVSLVNNSQDDSFYCLPHAFQLLVRKAQVLKNLTLMYTYTEDELDDLIHKLEDRIEAKSKKANQIRQSK